MVEWGGHHGGWGGAYLLTYLLCGEGKKSMVKCRLVNVEGNILRVKCRILHVDGKKMTKKTILRWQETASDKEIAKCTCLLGMQYCYMS
jgi:hypothetical protein